MYKKLNFLSAEQLEDILERFHLKNAAQKKKNYTWLIVLLAVLATAGAAFAVFKFFFEPADECDCDDDDYYEDDDIDYDEDFEDDDIEDTDTEETDDLKKEDGIE